MFMAIQTRRPRRRRPSLRPRRERLIRKIAAIDALPERTQRKETEKRKRTKFDRLKEKKKCAIFKWPLCVTRRWLEGQRSACFQTNIGTREKLLWILKRYNIFRHFRNFRWWAMVTFEPLEGEMRIWRFVADVYYVLPYLYDKNDVLLNFTALVIFNILQDVFCQIFPAENLVQAPDVYG